MAEFDINGDKVIDSQDAIYADLKIWRDLNSNGLSEANELQSLEDVGVESLNLTYAHASSIDENGNEHRQQGSYVDSDGVHRLQ